MSALIEGKTAAWRSAFLGGNCADCVLQLAANFAHLGGGDAIEKRECNGPLADAFRYRQRIMRRWQVPIRWLQMDGSEIPSTADSVLAKSGNNRISMVTLQSIAQANHVDEPADAAFGDVQLGKNQIRISAQLLVIHSGHFGSARENAFYAAKLFQPERALHLRQSVVVADNGVLEPLAWIAAALVAQRARHGSRPRHHW